MSELESGYKPGIDELGLPPEGQLEYATHDSEDARDIEAHADINSWQLAENIHALGMHKRGQLLEAIAQGTEAASIRDGQIRQAYIDFMSLPDSEKVGALLDTKDNIENQDEDDWDNVRAERDTKSERLIDELLTKYESQPQPAPATISSGPTLSAPLSSSISPESVTPPAPPQADNEQAIAKARNAGHTLALLNPHIRTQLIEAMANPDSDTGGNEQLERLKQEFNSYPTEERAALLSSAISGINSLSRDDMDPRALHRRDQDRELLIGLLQAASPESAERFQGISLETPAQPPLPEPAQPEGLRLDDPELIHVPDSTTYHAPLASAEPLINSPATAIATPDVGSSTHGPEDSGSSTHTPELVGSGTAAFEGDLAHYLEQNDQQPAPEAHLVPGDIPADEPVHPLPDVAPDATHTPPTDHPALEWPPADGHQHADDLNIQSHEAIPEHIESFGPPDTSTHGSGEDPVWARLSENLVKGGRPGVVIEPEPRLGPPDTEPDPLSSPAMSPDASAPAAPLAPEAITTRVADIEDRVQTLTQAIESELAEKPHGLGAKLGEFFNKQSHWKEWAGVALSAVTLASQLGGLPASGPALVRAGRAILGIGNYANLSSKIGMERKLRTELPQAFGRTEQLLGKMEKDGSIPNEEYDELQALLGKQLAYYKQGIDVDKHYANYEAARDSSPARASNYEKVVEWAKSKETKKMALKVMAYSVPVVVSFIAPGSAIAMAAMAAATGASTLEQVRRAQAATAENKERATTTPEERFTNSQLNKYLQRVENYVGADAATMTPDEKMFTATFLGGMLHHADATMAEAKKTRFFAAIPGALGAGAYYAAMNFLGGHHEPTHTEVTAVHPEPTVDTPAGTPAPEPTAEPAPAGAPAEHTSPETLKASPPPLPNPDLEPRHEDIPGTLADGKEVEPATISDTKPSVDSVKPSVSPVAPPESTAATPPVTELVGPPEPARVTEGFVGPPEPGHTSSDFVGPPEPAVKEPLPTPSGELVGPPEPARVTEGFVGPPEPAHTSSDFVGPPEPAEKAPTLLEKNDLIVPHDEAYKLFEQKDDHKIGEIFEADGKSYVAIDLDRNSSASKAEICEVIKNPETGAFSVLVPWADVDGKDGMPELMKNHVVKLDFKAGEPISVDGKFGNIVMRDNQDMHVTSFFEGTDAKPSYVRGQDNALVVHFSSKEKVVEDLMKEAGRDWTQVQKDLDIDTTRRDWHDIVGRTGIMASADKFSGDPLVPDMQVQRVDNELVGKWHGIDFFFSPTSPPISNEILAEKISDPELLKRVAESSFAYPDGHLRVESIRFNSETAAKFIENLHEYQNEFSGPTAEAIQNLYKDPATREAAERLLTDYISKNDGKRIDFDEVLKIFDLATTEKFVKTIPPDAQELDLTKLGAELTRLKTDQKDSPWVMAVENIQQGFTRLMNNIDSAKVTLAPPGTPAAGLEVLIFTLKDGTNKQFILPFENYFANRIFKQ